MINKTTLLFTLIFVGVCLVACDPNSYYYNYEDLKDSVVAVELIRYDNADAKTLFENRDGVIAFDFTKMELIETLAEEQLK